MQMREFGRTGLKVSVFGFGCGAVGGLMVRGDLGDQERAVARALEAGVNYFDTAVLYGEGRSETNLGRVLARLKPEIVLGTKVRLKAGDAGKVADAVAASVEGSLKRLGRDHVDILHLHNPVEGDGDSVPAQLVLDEVIPAFERLRRQGKIRFLGMTAVGETEAISRVIDSGAFHSAQVVYNLLNPSAAEALPAGYPAQDYDRLFDRTTKAGTGVVGIRVLGGGALSGTAERNPIASPAPAPLGSALAYETDLERAQRLAPLVQEGFAASLSEAAIRFSLSHAAMGTILVGMASMAELENALAAIAHGPLPRAALDRLATLRRGFAGETR